MPRSPLTLEPKEMGKTEIKVEERKERDVMVEQGSGPRLYWR